MVNFGPIDRATPYLLPPSVEGWLPQEHLARFVVDIVEQPDHDSLYTFRKRFLKEIEAQLEAEVKEMLARAEAADQEPLPEGLILPEELAAAAQSRGTPDRSDQPHRCGFAHHAPYRQGLRAELQRAGRS